MRRFHRLPVKVLVVDDDRTSGLILRDLIAEPGFFVEVESDTTRAVARITKETYGLVILGQDAGGSHGFEPLRQVRRSSQVPVMILTSRASCGDRVLAFNLGADDYLTRPFDPQELLGRVRAILRRVAHSANGPTEALHVGDFTLWPGTRQAFFRGRQLPLTAMEYEILERLVRSSGRVVSRDDLCLHLYNRPASPLDRAVDTHVSRIRRKIGKELGLILSVRGTGYQLRCEPKPDDPNRE